MLVKGATGDSIMLYYTLRQGQGYTVYFKENSIMSQELGTYYIFFVFCCGLVSADFFYHILQG